MSFYTIVIFVFDKYKSNESAGLKIRKKINLINI